MNAEPHDPVSDSMPDRSVKPRAAARKGSGRTVRNELNAAQPLLGGRQTGIDPSGQWPNGSGRGIEPDALVQPLDSSIDLRAVQADIGQRVIVERGQFLVGPAAITPIGEHGARRDEHIDKRHRYTPGTRMVHCTNNLWPPYNQPEDHKSAMRAPGE
jgi:hypothetical protein